MKPLLLKIRSSRAPYAERSSGNELFGRGVEVALALLLFVLLGWAVDNWLGTKPLFIIVFAVLAVIGCGARLYYAYNESMKHHEAERAERALATRVQSGRAEARR